MRFLPLLLLVATSATAEWASLTCVTRDSNAPIAATPAMWGAPVPPVIDAPATPQVAGVVVHVHEWTQWPGVGSASVRSPSFRWLQNAPSVCVGAMCPPDVSVIDGWRAAGWVVCMFDWSALEADTQGDVERQMWVGPANIGNGAKVNESVTDALVRLVEDATNTDNAAVELRLVGHGLGAQAALLAAGRLLEVRPNVRLALLDAVFTEFAKDFVNEFDSIGAFVQTAGVPALRAAGVVVEVYRATPKLYLHSDVAALNGVAPYVEYRAAYYSWTQQRERHMLAMHLYYMGYGDAGNADVPSAGMSTERLRLLAPETHACQTGGFMTPVTDDDVFAAAVNDVCA
jgi:pimeloyl-ACP methyl ester carboxylesterase